MLAMKYELDSQLIAADQRAILVVDDDFVALRLVTHMLARANYRVIGCARPGDAVERALNGNVAVVVSDIDMPEMSGLSLLKLLRERGLQMPVILASGRSDAEYGSTALESGAFAFLGKPFERQALLHLVDGAWSHHLRLSRPTDVTSPSPAF